MAELELQGVVRGKVWLTTHSRNQGETGAQKDTKKMRGDSYDNALAESVIGLYKTEVIQKQGPWRSFEQLELATAR